MKQSEKLKYLEDLKRKGLLAEESRLTQLLDQEEDQEKEGIKEAISDLCERESPVNFLALFSMNFQAP